MAADSKGYYVALGLSAGASIEVVKAVYRQLAKECHPDRPGCRDRGERFRQITEAYDALSDATFKSWYDRGEKQPPADHAEPPAQVDPVLCQVCSKVTAQPRRLAFWRVTSFVLGSHKDPVQRVYCSDCAAKEQWKSTFWTSLLGWWGIPWGPAWSIMYGVTNASGGTRDTNIDEALMWQNAVAFATRGNGPLAVGLSNVLRKSDNAEIGKRSAEIISFFADRGIDPNTTLRDVWKRSFGRTATLFAAAFVVPAAALALAVVPIGGISYPPTMDSSSTQDADSILDNAFGPSAEQASAPVAEKEQTSPPESTCDTVPSNGEVLVDHRGAISSGHQVEIDNGTSGDAIIKVRNLANDQALASFFVSRGQSATLKGIPDGEYKVQYAVGDKLAANCRTFVSDGSASASEFPDSETLQTRYEEELDGTRIIHSRLGYTLYSVPDGNVHPSDISLAAFNKP